MWATCWGNKSGLGGPVGENQEKGLAGPVEENQEKGWLGRLRKIKKNG
jgi:hypothetical protein